MDFLYQFKLNHSHHSLNHLNDQYSQLFFFLFQIKYDKTIQLKFFQRDKLFKLKILHKNSEEHKENNEKINAHFFSPQIHGV